MPWIFAKFNSLYEKESFITFNQSQNFAPKSWDASKINLQTCIRRSDSVDSTEQPHNPFQKQALIPAAQKEIKPIEIPFLNVNPVRLHRSQPEISSILPNQSIRQNRCQSEIRKRTYTSSVGTIQSQPNKSTAKCSHVPRLSLGQYNASKTAVTSSLKPSFSKSKIINVTSDNPRILSKSPSDISTLTYKSKSNNDLLQSQIYSSMHLPPRKNMSAESDLSIVDYDLTPEEAASSENLIIRKNPRKKRKKKRTAIFHRPMRHKRKSTITVIE
ncbi:hypothetical protein TNIN_92401 [Trichonephila inaurata madagascariensis]|uniref:Uncharacterized protein n=1 Tax=Trichonephila inaurata madagascariensis TaxID=2747483 RepID=A0A8X6XW70_9ARAC|nr:hypothetical protein TNIN_92401 [Trichonephila inaurata madagascariensis]